MKFSIESEDLQGGGSRKYLVFEMEENDEDFGAELKEMGEIIAFSCLLEYFEEELEEVLPEEIGALTSAPILVDLTSGYSPRALEDLKVAYPDDFKVEDHCGDIYWFPKYEVESMIDTLVDTGKVRMEHGGSVTKKEN